MRKSALIVPNASNRLVFGQKTGFFVFCIDATALLPLILRGWLLQPERREANFEPGQVRRLERELKKGDGLSNKQWVQTVKNCF